MRVVIVGATGNVGTSLIQSLEKEPEVTSVLGLARRLRSWEPHKTQWARAAIVSDDLASHLDGADAVVHLAWLFKPTHAPMTTWANNVVGSMRVFRAVAKARVPALIYASSIGAYSPGPKDRAVAEDWSTDGLPTAGYSREKAYVERVLDSFECENPDIRVVRMRPGFIFKPEAASQQRRLFAGPLLLNLLGNTRLIPVFPDVPGLAFQALRSEDMGDAYRLAITRPVRGAFNIAAEPLLDGKKLAEIVGARPVKVPVRVARAAVAAAWHLHLAPAAPQLFDLTLSFPTMDTTRAHHELGWSPRYTSVDAVRAFLEGLREGTGMETPPLAVRTSGMLRRREFATGIGEEP